MYLKTTTLFLGRIRSHDVLSRNVFPRPLYYVKTYVFFHAFTGVLLRCGFCARLTIWGNLDNKIGVIVAINVRIEKVILLCFVVSCCCKILSEPEVIIERTRFPSPSKQNQGPILRLPNLQLKRHRCTQ
jgi:hypothetical protein